MSDRPPSLSATLSKVTAWPRPEVGMSVALKKRPKAGDTNSYLRSYAGELIQLLTMSFSPFSILREQSLNP